MPHTEAAEMTKKDLVCPQGAHPLHALPSECIIDPKAVSVSLLKSWCLRATESIRPRARSTSSKKFSWTS